MVNIELNRIYNIDCLEGMKQLKDKSINLIVIDPPYNIKKAKWDKWETVSAYVEFMSKVFIECQRVLMDNGSFYFFHNDFEQMAELQHWLKNNSDFKFNSLINWYKPKFRSLSWKNPSDKSNLRSWFNLCEYCLFYTLQDETGSNKASQEGVRNYLRIERDKAGFKNKDINKILGYPSNGGGYASHYFGECITQCSMPTEEHYMKLQQTGFFQKPYEVLRKEYEALRYTHNLDENHNNVWISEERNNGKLHPTQKPLDIINRIIKTSSNKNDIILDCFMGSGTTAISAINTNRQFIGFELNKTYFNIANNRINNLNESLNNSIQQLALTI